MTHRQNNQQEEQLTKRTKYKPVPVGREESFSWELALRKVFLPNGSAKIEVKNFFFRLLFRVRNWYLSTLKLPFLMVKKYEKD